MNGDSRRQDYLKRLPGKYYQGGAQVHWVMTIAERRRGWLDDAMHGSVRESLLHTMARYRLVCPVYTLMPDHAHFLWCGCAKESDQSRAASFFRREWNAALKSRECALQKQAYDHVLVDAERERDAFEETCLYIMRNPERAKLVPDWRGWNFSGTMVPGYPWLEVRDRSFWTKFWSAYNALRDDRLLD